MIVNKTSVFPAPRKIVFEKLQKLETLQYIAKPFAEFESVGDVAIIPFGTHTIHIVRFDPDGISSREGNKHVPVWNHNTSTLE